MKNKLNLFSVLKSITIGDYGFIDTLSEEQLKEFKPYVIQLWLKNSDVNERYRYVFLSEYVNNRIFSLSDHPKLLYKLMCVASGLKDNARYKFNHYQQKKDNKINIVSEYYSISYDKAADSMQLIADDDVVEMAYDMGYTPVELTKMRILS